MMRENLIAAVRDAVEGLDYAFCAGNLATIAGRINSFPAVWVAPPELVSSDGEVEKLDTYLLTVRFMALQQEDIEKCLSKLESSGVVLCRSLDSDLRIRRVYGVKSKQVKPMTKHAEAGVEFQLKAEIFYCLSEESEMDK